MPIIGDDGFHWPEAPAELALDSLLLLNDYEDQMGWYATNTPGRDRRRDWRYAHYFSPALRAAWVKAEVDAVKKNCDGVYVEGDMCGIDIHPISCSQDLNEDGYIYRTESTTADTAIISYRWPQFPKVAATYRMVRNGNRWILDGVSCTGYLKFNME